LRQCFLLDPSCVPRTTTSETHSIDNSITTGQFCRTGRVEQEIQRNKENGSEYSHRGQTDRQSLSTHNNITQNGRPIREKCCLSCLWPDV